MHGSTSGECLEQIHLAAFRDRSGAGIPEGFVEVNTHIDPIDWHGSRSVRPAGALIEALAGPVQRRVVDQADRGEPGGLPSHHLVHDEATWFFFEALLEQIARLVKVSPGQRRSRKTQRLGKPPQLLRRGGRGGHRWRRSAPR